MNDVVEHGAAGAELAEPLPCVVHHPDAGGQCERAATTEVYGLNFCALHGEEAQIGAALREHYEAGIFFERFNSQHVPAVKGLVGRELAAAAARLREESPTDEDHYRALRNAYPSEAAPEHVREAVREWVLDSIGESGPSPLDSLLDSLCTVCALMRTAHEDGQTWLVEVLEEKRESIAAQAAVALEGSEVPEHQPG